VKRVATIAPKVENLVKYRSMAGALDTVGATVFMAKFGQEE